MTPDQLPADHSRLKYVLFFLLITCLVYGEAVTFPFLNLDDNTYLVGNEYAHQWSSLPRFFTGAAGSNFAYKSANYTNYYRPINSTWVLLNYKLFGLHPALWHLMAVAMYLLGAWLLWRVVWHLTRDDLVSMAAVLFYALHPMHVEGVVWLSGATVETLLSVLFLAGFLSYLLWRENRRLIWLGTCEFMILLALLTKESAAALPVLIILHALIFRTDSDKAKTDKAEAPGRRWLLPVATAVSVVAVYILVRFSVIHSTIVSSARHSWKDVFLSAPLLFVTQLQHALWPTQLAPFYDVRVITVASWKLFYLPLIVCIVFAVVTLWAVVRKPLAGFLLLWWIVALGPSLVGVLSFPDADVVVQDRFTFVALAGLCALVAGGLRLLPTAGRPLFGFQPASAVVLACVTVFLGVLSALQVNTWRSDISMSQHAIEVSPHSDRPRMILGAEYVKRKDFDHALAVYRDVINIDPDQWGAYYAYGVTLTYAGHIPEAVPPLTHAIQLAPTAAPPYVVLADVLSKQGRFDDAYRVLQQGIASVHDPSILRIQLAGIHAAQQQLALSR
jgi:hypothetical protein